ncbi:hypothetical protein GSbR_14340 [Geobacter sp. SVR]|nr:hypothetical protein GSVR_43790 [Geobacter sp. SVR]GCF84834.1 hypothetical protein GSbR_14340 [Geobacter sp. SVR]
MIKFFDIALCAVEGDAVAVAAEVCLVMGVLHRHRPRFNCSINPGFLSTYDVENEGQWGAVG